MLLVAGGVRFWQLGQIPAGLYRDEAFNGLDVLNVLDGHHALFFPANNGREPSYIYLSAVMVAIFGRSVFVLRLGAALVGTLTTVLVYRLGKLWFGRHVGLWAAWLWAVTLWPMHLSRIGLRIILLAPALTLAFWLGTLAYKRCSRVQVLKFSREHLNIYTPEHLYTWALWLLAGVAYGLCFYTYLAARFTPVLLLVLAGYLVIIGRFRFLYPGAVWFAAGAALTAAPLVGYLLWLDPHLILGRAGQVSVFTVNEGNVLTTLLQHTAQAVGMFFWHGDTILRHNPAGRPVFDVLMAAPFLIGLGWCLWHWRRPPATAVLLWSFLMLGPTILAADTPHFLRAAGVLPAILFLPAIGLDQLWRRPRLPARVRQGGVLVLAVGSLAWTVRDYAVYGRSADTGYLFEKAATDLADQIDQEDGETAVLLDTRFWSGWPSIPFLVDQHPVTIFEPAQGLPPQPLPAAIYAWPHSSLEFVPAALPPPALIQAQLGSLARGDLEPQAYPLYVRYFAQSPPANWPLNANFDNQLHLRQTQISTDCLPQPNCLQVTLSWGAETAVSQPLTAFVHIVGTEGLIGQHDSPPANGQWPHIWWQPGYILQDVHTIPLNQPFDATQHQIWVGLYNNAQVRLPILDVAGQPVGDAWQVEK